MTKLDYSQDSSIKIEALQNQLAEVSQSARSLATRLAVAKATLSDIATCRGVSSANSAEALAWAMNYAKEAVDDINAETESAALYSAQPSLDANLLLHRKALSVAMRYLAPLQPGDSRAVDDWFVACAAVQCDLTDHDGAIERCLDAAMLYPEPQRPEPVVVTYQAAPSDPKVAALVVTVKPLAWVDAPDGPDEWVTWCNVAQDYHGAGSLSHRAQVESDRAARILAALDVQPAPVATPLSPTAVDALQAQLAEARTGLEKIADCPDYRLPKPQDIARDTLTRIGGGQ